MIFSKQEAARIESGRKTMLLAPAARDELTGLPKLPARFRVGEDVGVQNVSKGEEVTRIEIRHLRLVTLADLDFAGAKALGFRTQAEMADDWMTRHDGAWPETEEALCGRCDGFAELTEDDEPACDGVEGDECPDCEHGVVRAPVTVVPDDIVARFRERHGHRQVWAVSFVVPPDPIRLLAEDSTRGYTTKRSEAVGGEPEAIDATTADRFARRSRELRADGKRREVDEAASLEGLIRLAQQQGVDTRDFSRAAERLRKRLRDYADRQAA